MYNYYCDRVNSLSVTEQCIFAIRMHPFLLPRSFCPTSARLSPSPSISSDQETHPSVHQDTDRSTWRWRLRGRGRLVGGGGWRGPHKPSCHLGGWRQVLRTTYRADSYGRHFSEHLPLFFYLLLLFNLPVLSNQYVLSLHWCSDIYLRWGVRVYSDAFFLSVPVWCPYHYSLPHFDLSCLDFLNGDNCPLLEIIISCNSSKYFPWCYPLCSKDDNRISCPDGLDLSRCHRGPINLFNLFWFRPQWCLGCC